MKRVEELSLLHDISWALEKSIDLKQVMQPIIDIIAERMGLVRGAITLVDKRSGEISIDVASGLSSRQKTRGIYQLGEGITGKVVESGKQEIIPDISRDPHFLNRTGIAIEKLSAPISFVCIPIKISSETIGTFSAHMQPPPKTPTLSEAPTADMPTPAGSPKTPTAASAAAAPSPKTPTTASAAAATSPKTPTLSKTPTADMPTPAGSPITSASPKTPTAASAAAATSSETSSPTPAPSPITSASPETPPAPDPPPLESAARLLTIISSMIAQAVHLRRDFLEERRQLQEENTRLQRELMERFRPANIIGNTTGMREVFDMIAQVCRSDATVLIRGESGTGKELVAQAIHYNSLRKHKPFIRVNCGALPETIIESELFGHEKGAFTSAHEQRKGRFELAHNGTIFLDEIGDFPPSLQIKLLRVLQEREFERVGGNKTIRTNVRIITATNQDLEQLMAERAFREDLYYRLNVFPIHIPPLRERKSDILFLADHFVATYSQENHKVIKRISTPAIDMLTNYHWPGNVRELENCIERAILLTNDEVIHGQHLPPTLQSAEYTHTQAHDSLQDALDSLEHELVIDALKSAKGNIRKASDLLKISSRILGLRIAKYRLDPKKYR